MSQKCVYESQSVALYVSGDDLIKFLNSGAMFVDVVHDGEVVPDANILISASPNALAFFRVVYQSEIDTLQSEKRKSRRKTGKPKPTDSLERELIEAQKEVDHAETGDDDSAGVPHRS